MYRGINPFILILVGVTILVGLFLLAGSEKPEEIRVRQELYRMKNRQNVANEVVDAVEYIKDPRTGLCFAYYWGGQSNGGPALTRVPCDSVPAKLLTTAELFPETN